MKIFKKFYCVALIAMIGISFSACGSNDCGSGCRDSFKFHGKRGK